MTPQQKIIIQIYFLTDILESKITHLNPIRNVKDNEDQLLLTGTLSRLTKLRSYLDKGLKTYSEGWGDISDEIIDAIDKIINEKSEL